jgi:hypothetical protein
MNSVLAQRGQRLSSSSSSAVTRYGRLATAALSSATPPYSMPPYSMARTISSVIFLASPNSIMVLSWKNRLLSMPA